jgi:large subunit ribosomal protein L9
MKVIFIKDLKGQGKKNEIKEVSDGYAKNFLINKGYAVPLTQTSMKVLDKEIKNQKETDEANKKEALKLKEKLEKLTLEFKLKTGKNGSVFGSISTKQIVSALGEYKIDKTKIKSPIINALGYHNIEIELYKDVKATLKVHVSEE